MLCSIPLPRWVAEEMERDPDLCYSDQWGRRNYEYVSLGCDTLPVLKGRTPVQCYADFMRAFRDQFESYLGTTIVVRNQSLILLINNNILLGVLKRISVIDLLILFMATIRKYKLEWDQLES